MFGNWDMCKYAVLVSAQEVDKSNLVGIRPEDTYFDGNVSLGKQYYILMPKAEINNKMPGLNPNPNATIVSYDGLSLDEAIFSFIAYTGRKPERISSDQWVTNDFQYVEPVLAEHKIPRAASHFGSKYMLQRIMENSANKIIAISDFLKQNNLNPTNEELEEIITVYCKEDNLAGEWRMEEIDILEKYYLPVFKKHGYSITIPEEEKKNLRDFKGKESKVDIINKYVVQSIQNGNTFPGNVETKKER